ncbi:8-oxo-dGTP diphosphatase [Candidatus Pacearchaeota archaeon]|nr:8-oxo-dGTP diphosphatase [Candidatus Pacearchaeota archaeon]
MTEKKKLMTVVLFHDEENQRILLGLKKKGFGEGKWNGFGGKVEAGETINKAARRELFEEAGILAGELEKVGLINFRFTEEVEETLEIHFLRALKVYGMPRETEEMRPEWFNINSIPYDKMWVDDKYWMPSFLEGKKFKGDILFKNQDTILSNNIRIVEGIF